MSAALARHLLYGRSLMFDPVDRGQFLLEARGQNITDHDTP
jgi:hypothetical protein